jgi:hypothetical protein
MINNDIQKYTERCMLFYFFDSIPLLRNAEKNRVVQDFIDIRDIDKELADKMVLCARDINNGYGERRVGRILLQTLATLDPTKVIRNLSTFVEIGRWDDLFILEGTPCEDAMWKFIKKQIKQDLDDMKDGKNISYLFKWMPSINTSSKEKVRLAKKICTLFGYTEREYRKMLSKGREYLRIVERKMSANQWDDIIFEVVPVAAKRQYHKSFKRHCSSFDYEQKECPIQTVDVNQVEQSQYELMIEKLNSYEYK